MLAEYVESTKILPLFDEFRQVCLLKGNQEKLRKAVPQILGACPRTDCSATSVQDLVIFCALIR